MMDYSLLKGRVVWGAVVVLLVLGGVAVGVGPDSVFGQATNADPTFADTTPSRNVDENTPPGVNIGDPIVATDADEDTVEYGDTLTYSLGGTDAASFDIDSSTGQLITKAALNAEGATTTYTVVVTATDGAKATGTATVTITVNDLDEPPAAPIAPTVVSGEYDETDTTVNESTMRVKVVWHAPENTGPAIDSYEVQYKKTTETSFTASTATIANRITTITGLDADTSYQVRVRAVNAEGTGLWSLVGTGSTNKGSNKPPAFIDRNTTGIITRDVNENEEAGENVDRPVAATDDGVLPLTYRLEGPDAGLFDFNPSLSQIRTKRGVTYNHEDPECGYVDTATPTECAYYVTVTAFDGKGGSDAQAVKIEVNDVPEAPGLPRRITVRATEESSRSLDVIWEEPENAGPPITGYDVRYRQGNTGTFRTVAVTDTKVTIAPVDTNLSDGDSRLTPGASYEVYVRAKTNELNSQFSARVTGRTSSGNRQPMFDARQDEEERRVIVDPSSDSRVVNRSVNENTRTGQSVGAPVFANDRDKLTYKLIADPTDADDVNKFDINESTGQILTKDPLNHEDTTCGYIEGSADPTTCTYNVQVQVWDGLDEHGNTEDPPAVDDIIKVTITVNDRPESPTAPVVLVTSPEVPVGATIATLTVTWYAPENMSTAPPLARYEVECSGAGITTCPQPTGLTLTNSEQSYGIDNLSPGSSYQVRVRAVNAEGLGAWSTLVRQSTSKAGNLIPTLDTAVPTDLTVDENTPAGRSILSTSNPEASHVDASNGDGDGRVMYSLHGPNAVRFTIDANGQIKTKSPLNHEDDGCGYDATAGTTECSYTMKVKVSDNDGGSISQDVTIRVTDNDEPPSAPTRPGVTATNDSGWSLEVTWSEPRNTGPEITDYDVRYRKVGESDWQDWPHVTNGAGNTETKTKISTIVDADNNTVHLEPRTQYEVEIRAKNGEGDGTDPSPADAANWSQAGRGTTGQSNKRPSFADTNSMVTLRVDENTRAGQNIGSAVEATDADRNSPTYSLEGPGAASFAIVASSGQIRTRAPLNYEERNRYSLTVKVDDRQGRDNSVAVKSVTIIVDDVDERPSAPPAPRVTGIAGSTDSVRVTWDEPTNTGPAITDYDVRCLDCPGNVSHDGADRSAIITGLTPGTRYAVEVRANNGELTGDWSRSGTGSPNPDVANQKPIFSGGTRSFDIAENERTGDPIGSPVTAVDPDLDPVTHTLEGADAASFDIDPGSGQIRASADLNHEDKARHSVTVKATDTRGGSATVSVTINVTDISEPPDTPLAPRVTAVSSSSVQVTWDEPGNTGPPITDYDYRHRTGSASWTEVTNTTIAGRTVTISGLTPNTFYDVEVRATNDEGTSGWSNPGNGSTNAPGANNLPVFSEGASTTRSVRASAQPNTPVGAPVAAADADSGDTITYRLEGRDAPFFEIRPTTGQLITRSGITLTVDETYTVTVAADDGTDIARIQVSIDATSAPPNALPVFTEGASATRSVSISATAGTSIGQPVRATDTDTGDTLTYTLEGTDSASFGINSSTGQLLTLSGVTLAIQDYSVTVVATDNAGDRATISVTISATGNPGTVRLSPSRPEVGETVTATLTDPDGGVTSITWQWATSTNGTSNWVIILGANSNSYTPTVTNVGSYMRATASYTDAGAPGQSAEGITAAAVAQDDDGTVTLSTSAPRVGSSITARLSDPDGGVSNVSWAWEKSSSRTSGWTAIANATRSSYTPRQGDLGSYLRATASYTDAVGSGKSAEAVTTSTVAVQELIGRYDSNGNGSIEKSEALEAVKDYFDDELTLTEVVKIIQEFFDS